MFKRANQHLYLQSSHRYYTKSRQAMEIPSPRSHQVRGGFIRECDSKIGLTLDIQNPLNTWWGSVFGTPKSLLRRYLGVQTPTHKVSGIVGWSYWIPFFLSFTCFTPHHRVTNMWDLLWKFRYFMSNVEIHKKSRIFTKDEKDTNNKQKNKYGFKRQSREESFDIPVISEKTPFRL